jgi:NAD(P)-dependent dehydrogenase (short-subunit alcohol dehydrogenase family)
MVGTVVLTGATSGIGRAAAIALAGRVDHLLLHGPERRGDKLVGELIEAAGQEPTRVQYLQADYSRLAEVRRLAADIASLVPQIDVLVNNAGRPGPPRREVTPDGHESTLQVNYLAPVLLTELLLSRPGMRRVVNVASATHFGATLDRDDLELEHRYAGPAAYARSKLALVTYTCWLASERADTEVVSMHPGVIATDLLHAMFSVRGDSPAAAAENIVVVMGRRDDSGAYYDERRRTPPNDRAGDRRAQHWLREWTEAALAIHSEA